MDRLALSKETRHKEPKKMTAFVQLKTLFASPTFEVSQPLRHAYDHSRTWIISGQLRDDLPTDICHISPMSSNYILLFTQANFSIATDRRELAGAATIAKFNTTLQRFFNWG